MNDLINWFPWASLWPFAVAVAGWWCLARGVGLAVKIIKYFRGGAFALLLFLPVVVFADDPPVSCSTVAIADANEIVFNTLGWTYYCMAERQWCTVEPFPRDGCAYYNYHAWVQMPSCVCDHVLLNGNDCPSCTGVFVHDRPPPIDPPIDPPADETDVGVWPLIIGFGSGLASIGALFSLRLIWRSINSGLDVYDRD
jgi:hypothetical protein